MTKSQQKLVNLTARDMQSFLQNDMAKEIEAFATGSTLKSGYANLDAYTNLYPGLYVIGAISSLGKTTFIHQMSDQLAEQGEQVLYFSLEQSTLELASKSLSRLTARGNIETALTSLQIRKTTKFDARIENAKAQLFEYANNLHIIESPYEITIQNIENFVNNYVETHQTKPIVIIDYLQMLKASDSRLSTKEQVDQNVFRLKKLQIQHNLVVIVISSFNRQNYLTQVDFESFKESGGIEYTADVVWGLQLHVLHAPNFTDAKSIDSKRKLYRTAKATIPRKIELVCLKNRFGISSYSCSFNYYAQFDLFLPDMKHIDETLIKLNADKDGFFQIPKDYDISLFE